MAIKDLIGAGIGFNPGSLKFIITRGLSIGVAVITPPNPFIPLSVHSTAYSKSVHRTQTAKVVVDGGVGKVVK